MRSANQVESNLRAVARLPDLRPHRRRHLDRGTVRDAPLGHSPGRREDAGLEEPPASFWAFAARSIPLLLSV
jgi:hypothetical protein